MAMNSSSNMHRRGPLVSLGSALIVISLLLFSMLVGLLTVILPPGFLIRSIAIPLGIGILLIAWALRTKDATMPPPWVLTLLLIAAGLSVVWPRYIYFPLGGIYVNPQTLSILIALAVLLFWFIYSPQIGARVRTVAFTTKIGALILFWFSWRLFTAVIGDFPLQSTLAFLRETIYLGSFLLIGLGIVSFEQGPRYLLRVLVLAGFLIASIGLVEAYMQRNFLVQFASGDADAAESLWSLAVERVREGSFRTQSIFTHPIAFAQFIAAMLPLSVYFVLYERGPFWRIVGLLLIPIGVLAILKSGSRAGVISLAVASVFGLMVLWLRAINSRGFGKAFAIAALPVFALVVGFAYWVVQELTLGRTAMEAGSTATRVLMLELGVKALTESPIAGFGQGMAIVKAGVVNASGIATIDSYLLTVALDAGYVGLLMFLVIIAVFAFRGAVAAVRLDGAEGARIGMIVASVLAIVATFVGLSIVHNLTLMWLLIALGLPLINKSVVMGQRRRG